MGMSSYVMDCEEQFINSVNLRIGGCEHITELHMALTRDKCWNDIAHMSDNEKLEFVEELWVSSGVTMHEKSN